MFYRVYYKDQSHDTYSLPGSAIIP